MRRCFLALELALALFWNKADSDTGKYSWQQYICAYTPNRLLANVLIELPLQSTMITTKWEKSEMLGGLGCMFLLVTQILCSHIFHCMCASCPEVQPDGRWLELPRSVHTTLEAHQHTTFVTDCCFQFNKMRL